MLDNAQELIDIIDKDNNILKTILRKDFQKGVDLARVVHVFVVDENNNFILQQRDSSKIFSPNLLESVGGFVASGETPEETAKKELREEFGLDLPIEHQFEFLDESHGIVSVYKAVFTGDLSEIKLEENSVSRVFKLKAFDVYKMMRKTPFLFLNGFQKTFMHYWAGQFGHKKLSVVNAEGEAIAGCTWEEMEDEGHICEASVVIVTNDDNEILIQKRGPNVGTHPNTLDVSASGHVDEGEDAETAAYRETEEELGIKNIQLTYINKFYIEHDAGGYLKKEWINVYTGRYNGVINIEESELADAAWFTKENIHMLLSRMPNLFGPTPRKALKCYFDTK